MRVLLVSDNYSPNRDGVATSVASLASGLRESSHDVAVVAPRARASAPAVEYRTYLAPSFATGQGGFRFGWVSSRTLERLVEHHRPDVVHIHTLGSLGLQAARLCRRAKLKSVFTWHTDLLAYREAYPVLKLGIPAIYASTFLPQEKRAVGKALGATMKAALAGESVTPHHRRMLSNVAGLFDRVIVPSHKTAAELKEIAPFCVPTVIPSAAVRHGTLSVPLARRLKEMRKLIHCDGTAIAYVGRLSAEKNLETLLHAMARRVLPAVPGARLNIIGDGHRQKYERMAESLGISHAVAFAGPAPPELVGHLLSSCGLLAHPSLTETQGLVIAEAALVGLPAVVLDADLEGVVQHDHTGYVAASVDRFGAALVRLLQRPDIRNRLGANARSVAAEYTSARYASRVVDVYDELVPR
ncbi:MAG: glycosyltransferase [Actinomadura sp.]